MNNNTVIIKGVLTEIISVNNINHIIIIKDEYDSLYSIAINNHNIDNIKQYINKYVISINSIKTKKNHENKWTTKIINKQLYLATQIA